MRPALILLLALCLSACGDRGAAPAQAVVSDSMGVRVVDLGVPKPTESRGPRRPVFRTGWRDDEPTFETLRGGALVGTDLVAVMDDGAGVAYLISDDGEVTTVGRRGEGPGEFQSGEAVEVLGDRVLIYDYMLGRLNLVSRSGTHLESARWTKVGTVQLSPASGLRADRVAWVPSSYSARRTYENGTSWLEGPLVTTGPLGGTPDTVAVLPMIELRVEGGRRLPDPFVRYGTAAAYPGGFVWARNDVPEVRWYSETGDLQQVVRWQADLTPVDDVAWARYEAAYIERMSSSPERGSSEQMRQQLRESRAAASETLPLFRFIHAATDGSVPPASG